jgi:hypothetical protein
MRFLDGYKDRWGYALCFGANSCLMAIVFLSVLPGYYGTGVEAVVCPIDSVTLTTSPTCSQTIVKG